MNVVSCLYQLTTCWHQKVASGHTPNRPTQRQQPHCYAAFTVPKPPQVEFTQEIHLHLQSLQKGVVQSLQRFRNKGYPYSLN